MVHVFVPNRHGTGISVRCTRPYDEYRQFTPNPEGGAAAMQRCLITASRRTANANGDRGGRADVWLTAFYFDKVPTGLAMLELMCARECVGACAGARECVCDTITSTVSLYQQNQL